MIKFTKITAKNCQLTKTFSLNEHGQIESSAIAHMTEGDAKVEHLEKLVHLIPWLPLLAPNQAITCGVPAKDETPLTTRAGAEFRQDAVARTNESFHFPHGPSLFPIDVDVDTDAYPTVNSVLDALEACHPWLINIARIARPSSSSFIGERGLRGVHVYIAVSRGTDIDALKVRMQAEQWNAGMGRIKISKSGALLTRQLSDDLVYQPSRLMFEASPVLGEGVRRDVPAIESFIHRDAQTRGQPAKYKLEDGMLDVQALPTFREIEKRRAETSIRQGKNSRRREAKRIAIDYQKTNAIANGLDAQAGERYGLLATRALGDGRLPSDWTIFVKDMGRQTVQQILDAVPDSLGFLCADPFDSWRPDLDAKHCTKAEIVALGDKFGIWSHKLQQFFEFSTDAAANLSTPLDQAAEKLCGLVEYPEPAGKKSAPFVNIKFGIELLLKEIDALPRRNVSTNEIDTTGIPAVGNLIDALSRVGCAGVSPAPVQAAIEALSDVNSYDPWRDAVLALPQWDKVPRLDTFFPDLCESLPSEALTLSTQVFFAGVVMRQLNPGAPLPIVPVLIGGPGTGKTRFVHQLAEALGAPPPPAITFGDIIRMSMAASTSMISELSEMSGMGKRDAEEIKTWTTDTSDVYRAPYARKAESHPRRFAPLGTANKHEMNRDETGNRRFMPVYVMSPISPSWAVEARQVFAEAKTRFCDDVEEYARIVRRAPDVVKAYNDQDMREGIGTPHSDIDDILPDLIRQLMRRSGERRIKTAELRTLLDSHISGKQIRSREYAKWLTSRGWDAQRTASARYYVAPQDYLDEEANKPLLSVVSPFTGEKTA
jgi:hypothetical protein